MPERYSDVEIFNQVYDAVRKAIKVSSLPHFEDLDTTITRDANGYIGTIVIDYGTKGTKTMAITRDANNRIGTIAVTIG